MKNQMQNSIDLTSEVGKVMIVEDISLDKFLDDIK